MQRSIKLDAINSYLVCTLCNGYFVDATTLVECLHSFCRSCLVKYLENSHDCPNCGMEIHKTKPFDYIRSDPCLQEIVYKLVPDLYSSEEKRKRAYKKTEDAEEEAEKDDKEAAAAPPQPSTVAHPHHGPYDASEDSRILVTLKYFRGTSRFERIKTEKVLQMFPTRYLCCNPDMPVRVLKKFVCLKYDISVDLFNIELWRGDETLLEELTLKQLIQIYGLYRERKPLDLHFSLYPKFEPSPVKPEPPVSERKVVPPPPMKVEEDAVKTEDGGEEMDVDATVTSAPGDENVENVTIPGDENQNENESGVASDEKLEPANVEEERMEVDDSSSMETKAAVGGDNKTEEEKTMTDSKSDALPRTDEKEPKETTEMEVDNKTPDTNTQHTPVSTDDKAGTSKNDDSSLFKELKRTLTSSKNNLNTTDSDSSQKSNVSSLDVNLLNEEDLKPEALQTDFLNIFDSDSQHPSDLDTSGCDPNASNENKTTLLDGGKESANVSQIEADSAQQCKKDDALLFIPTSQPSSQNNDPEHATTLGNNPPSSPVQAATNASDEAMKTSTPLMTGQRRSCGDKDLWLSPVDEQSTTDTPQVNTPIKPVDQHANTPVETIDTTHANAPSDAPPTAESCSDNTQHPTTTSTTTTTAASSITALTTTTTSTTKNDSTASCDDTTPNTPATTTTTVDKDSDKDDAASAATAKTETSLTNKMMIASLVDCRVTLSNLPNLDQLLATTTINTSGNEQNTNSNTTSSFDRSNMSANIHHDNTVAPVGQEDET